MPEDTLFENRDKNLSFTEGETELSNIKKNKYHRDELTNSNNENNKRHKSQNDRIALLGDENNKLKNENNHLQTLQKKAARAPPTWTTRRDWGNI